MASPLNCFRRFLVSQKLSLIHMRHAHKFKTKNPRPKRMARRVYEELTLPIVPHKDTYIVHSCLDPNAYQNQTEEENPYEVFLIKQVQKDVDSSEMIVICHKQPCSSHRVKSAKVALQKHGMKLSICNNDHMKLVIKDTKLANLEPLFLDSNIRITCQEPKITQLMNVMRKFPEMIVLGGFVSDRLVTKDSLQMYSKLPSIEQLRGELVSCLRMAGGAKTLSLLNSQQQKLTSNLEQYRTELEESK